MSTVAVKLIDLPTSVLPLLLKAYKDEVEGTAETGKEIEAEAEPCARAERAALHLLLSHSAFVEFISCSNSPFFSLDCAQAQRAASLRYARRIVQTITRPTYSRYTKVLMLLLRELRFVVLVHDAQLFSRKTPAVVAAAVPANITHRNTAQAAVSAVEGDTVQRLSDAFQRISARRYYNAAQLLMQRDAVATKKNCPYDKALKMAFGELKGWIRTVCAAQLFLRDATRMTPILDQWAKQSIDVTAALKQLQSAAPSVVTDYLDEVSAQVKRCAERHQYDTRGSDALRLCARLRESIRLSAAPLQLMPHATETTLPQRRGRAAAPTPPSLTPATLLQILQSGGGGDGTRLIGEALSKFINTVDQVEMLAPELTAMNYLLRVYGLMEADGLAHQVDVIDGTFKRLVGDDFEDEAMEAEQRRVALQVLVPHCCAVTGCDAAMAQAWVLACLQASSALAAGAAAPVTATTDLPLPTTAARGGAGETKAKDAAVLHALTPAEVPLWAHGAAAGWLKPVPPPQYRLVRNVQYRWNAAGLLQLPRVDGELDGVVYDAETRQVLFVLEAKHNIADLGKACKQKDRLYGSLDLAWKTRAAPPTEPVKLSHKSGVKSEVVAAAAGGAAGGVSHPVELQFLVQTHVGAATTALSSDASSEKDEAAAERHKKDADVASVHGEIAVDDVESVDAPSPTSTTASAAKVKTIFFTQDNFTDFFRAPSPPAATTSTSATAAAAPVMDKTVFPDPTTATAAPIVAALLNNPTPVQKVWTREHRWVYLTSLRATSEDKLNSTAPSPGGEVYLVESALVSAMGDAVADAYQKYCQTGRVVGHGKGALKALFTSLEQSSFYNQCVKDGRGDAGVAMVPLFPLDLIFPAPSTFISPARPQPNTASSPLPVNPYERALRLWQDSVRLTDDTLAIQHVQLRNDFVSELHLSDRSLTFAVDLVAKRCSKRGKTTPSFCAVVKSLMELHCLRNLVMSTDSEVETILA